MQGTNELRSPSRSTERKDSDIDFCSLSSPAMPKVTAGYEYSAHDKASNIREVLSCNMLSLLALLLFLSLATFIVIMGVQYMVVHSPPLRSPHPSTEKRTIASSLG
jgi:nitric oxide reductase large subunit